MEVFNRDQGDDLTAPGGGIVEVGAITVAPGEIADVAIDTQMDYTTRDNTLSMNRKRKRPKSKSSGHAKRTYKRD